MSQSDVTADAYGVIGNPIAHSRSPQIHAAFALQTDQAIRYDPILAAPDAFDATVRQFIDRGGRGLNVTVPFKEQAFKLANTCSDAARLAGAVNTLSFDGENILADNTDGVGLVRDLTSRIGSTLDGSSIVLLGAGGAARGIIGPLLGAGVRQVFISNRTVARAEQLVGQWQESCADPISFFACGFSELESVLSSNLPDGQPAIWLNSTAASLDADTALPLPPAWLGNALLAYDLMYAARPTPFMVQAADAGCPAVADGLGMLVEQAAESFRIWRGCLPDTAPVYAALREQLR